MVEGWERVEFYSGEEGTELRERKEMFGCGLLCSAFSTMVSQWSGIAQLEILSAALKIVFSTSMFSRFSILEERDATVRLVVLGWVGPRYAGILLQKRSW